MELNAIGICKSFGDNQVLKDFTFTFEHGKITAIMGASGCGKSTLLSILMGILPADSGKVISSGAYRKSAVFQENRLCENLTVLSNIRLVTGQKYSSSDIEKELAAIGLDGCSSKPVRELSGGMKRRVALIRALLAEYDILFLDEPFKGLDSETRSSVINYTKEKTHDRTVIMVTHDKYECEQLADHLLKM